MENSKIYKFPSFPGSLCIAYVIEKFPSSSEYFILKEILMLEQYGVKAFVLSIRKPKLNVHITELIDLKAPVFYSSDISFTVQILNFLKCIIKLPIILINRRSFNIINVFKQLRYLFISYNFEKQLTNIKITHIHAHFAFIATDVGYELSRLLSVSFSFTAHAQDVFLNQVDIINKIEYAKFVLTCTSYNRKYLNKLTRQKYEGKIHHIYHGIKIENSCSIQKEEFNNKSTIRILTVGRLVEKKGVIYLLQAICILLDRDVKIVCRIVGDGPLKKELEYFVEKTGLGRHIKFLGTKERNEVLEEMSDADIFVLPSIIASNGDMDGLPNVLLEAMATGIPVISTAVSAIPELIENNQTGILIPERDEKAIANAILMLIKNIGLYNSIIINARERVQKDFDIHDSTEKIINLFKKYA